MCRNKINASIYSLKFRGGGIILKSLLTECEKIWGAMKHLGWCICTRDTSCFIKLYTVSMHFLLFPKTACKHFCWEDTVITVILYAVPFNSQRWCFQTFWTSPFERVHWFWSAIKRLQYMHHGGYSKHHTMNANNFLSMEPWKNVQTELRQASGKCCVDCPCFWLYSSWINKSTVLTRTLKWLPNFI
jgi:hypothetical protein